jgi:hypothetical protein
MTEEIRRRRTADPEIDALVVIEQALAGLPVDTCKRVLDWAMDRFIEERKRNISEMAMASIESQLRSIQEVAEALGATDRQFVHAIAHVRSLKKLAPAADDDDPRDTEAIARENLNA